METRSPASPAFAEVLRRYRLRTGQTQEELAERSGLTAKGIGALERGERLRPHRNTVDRLARALDLSPDDWTVFVETARCPPQAPAGSWSSSSVSTWPVPLTPFIGRTREVTELEALLQQPHVRLVTLTGPGGVGKTRLALQAAQDMATPDADAVYWVALASVQDPTLVAPAIASSLGLQDAPDMPLVERIKAYLRSRNVLLILDNFEHVMKATPLVLDLLTSCPRLSLLVTSRSVLGVSGEHVFAVPPMSLPEPGETGDLEAVAHYDAIALFSQRARLARTDFMLSADNVATVAAICRRVDGLPLGIELAASCTRFLPLSDLLLRLDRRLPILTRGGRDLPDRHQTLRNTIAWSYDLLDETEQKLLPRLSVFVGGCTLEAAEAVCNPDAAIDLLGGLANLVDASLVYQEGDGEARFAMLETIREYAGERLETSGEAPATRRRHADLYCALAEQAEPLLKGPSQAEWAERLERELPNLRAALAWSLQSGTVAIGLRLAAALVRFWWYEHDHLSEGRQWLERLLAAAGAVSPSIHAKALRGLGVLEAIQGDFAAAELHLQASLEIYREREQEWDVALAILFSGHVAWQQGDFERGAELTQESLVLFRRLGDTWGMAAALGYLGYIRLLQGDIQRCLDDAQEALELHRRLGDGQATILTLDTMGRAALERGEYARAAEYWREGLQLLRSRRPNFAVPLCLEGLAAVAGRLGQGERAAVLFGAAEHQREVTVSPLAPGEQPSYQRSVAVARAQIAETAWTDAWSRGRTMPLDQAIAYALGDCDQEL